MAEFDVPFSPPTYDVYRLAQDSAQGETVIGVKLTDECLNALAAAHKRKTRLKLVVDEQGGGTLAIGDITFRFSTQSLPTPFADAVSCKPGVGFKAKASVGLKYTIQATQNSFEETRAKAQKLMEEEKSRGTKDVSKSKNGKKTEVARGLSGSHSAAILAHARTASLGSNKQIATNVLGGGIGGINSRNASPNMNPAASAAAAQARMTVPYRADLMNKSLRERVIHIVITARYKSFDEIIGRLRKDGLPSEQDSRKGIEEILKEVSESSDSGRVGLKQCFHSEVNLKWKWLSTEEMNYIRKLQNPVNVSTTSFAPSRKSGVDRVMAPSATLALNTSTSSSTNSDKMRDKEGSRSSGSSNSSNNSSPEGVSDRTPPPKGVTPSSSSMIGGGGGAKKRSASPPIIMDTNTKDIKGEEDDSYYATSKRKAHAPPSSTTKTTPPQIPSSSHSSLSSRPVRQESASPPEDPTMAKEDIRGKSSKMTSVSPSPTLIAPPTSISSRTPCTPSTSPRTDWNTVYPIVISTSDADRYVNVFTTCYAEYVETHSKLSKIADEFTAMEKELIGCARGSNEAEEMEARIQSKYSHYEKDVDFIKLRNRHSDLRSKLSVIRSRLDIWESRR